MLKGYSPKKREPILLHKNFLDMMISDNILEFNRDLEPFIIQMSHGRSNEAFDDKYDPLTFVHCSDMHNSLEHWNRMVEFTNYYHKYVDFVIHTGDYCGGNQSRHTDMYTLGDPCEVPILNAVGNHDTMPLGCDIQSSSSKETVHKLLFGDHCKGWGATFMPGDASMSYYRDFEHSNVRLIVLDDYYDIMEQQVWLRELLSEANTKGISVITAMHEPTDRIVDCVDTSFHSINDWEKRYILNKIRFEDDIADFIDNGGSFIVNLAGHVHHPLFGYTSRCVLNMAVENGNSFKYWCDADRVKGTRTWDAFNVVSVDTELGTICAVCVGNNTDNFLRERKLLCYDYINKRIISG